MGTIQKSFFRVNGNSTNLKVLEGLILSFPSKFVDKEKSLVESSYDITPDWPWTIFKNQADFLKAFGGIFKKKSSFASQY